MEEEIKAKMIEWYNLIEHINWDVSETKQSLEDLEIIIKEKEENKIKDVEKLKRELERDGLYSKKLEEFLEDYMRYYNK